MEKAEELKAAIAASEEEIEKLEKKRLRSQSALLEAQLDKREPDARDAEYFKALTSLIRLEREKLRLLQAELNALAK